MANDSFKIMFYNVENFFDCSDDSLVNDNEFLPESSRYWNFNKFNDKRNKVAKVISAVGEGNIPSIIGLCEIENEYVLKQLVYSSPIKTKKYKYCHFNSPDKRGIDVALLYLPNRFEVVKDSAIKINFPSDSIRTTRDILYVKGIADKLDTLHIFVCHSPSRMGGAKQSENRRVFVTGKIKSVSDSILKSNQNSSIIIMGDFNDAPNDKSLTEGLAALPLNESIDNGNLYNLFYAYSQQTNIGTYKYKSNWQVLDQIIVSGALLNKNAAFYTNQQNANIYKADFLLSQDTKFMGIKLNRTYLGPRYLGGFSDHLPVWLNLMINK